MYNIDLNKHIKDFLLINKYQTLNIMGFIKNRKQKVNTDDLHNPTGVYIRENYFTYMQYRKRKVL